MALSTWASLDGFSANFVDAVGQVHGFLSPLPSGYSSVPGDPVVQCIHSW